MGTVATQASMSLDGYIDLLDRRQAPAQPTALRCSSFRHDLHEYPYESVMVAIPVTCDNDTSIADPAGAGETRLRPPSSTAPGSPQNVSPDLGWTLKLRRWVPALIRYVVPAGRASPPAGRRR